MRRVPVLYSSLAISPEPPREQESQDFPPLSSSSHGEFQLSSADVARRTTMGPLHSIYCGPMIMARLLDESLRVYHTFELPTLKMIPVLRDVGDAGAGPCGSPGGFCPWDHKEYSSCRSVGCMPIHYEAVRREPEGAVDQAGPTTFGSVVKGSLDNASGFPFSRGPLGAHACLILHFGC